MVAAVARIVNFPVASRLNGIDELNAYVEANPKQRCSLGSISSDTQELISDNMPPGTKVQVFSNRLPVESVQNRNDKPIQ
jgi:CRISPR-associated protein Csc3